MLHMHFMDGPNNAFQSKEKKNPQYKLNSDINKHCVLQALIISHSGIDDKTFSRAKQAKTLAL